MSACLVVVNANANLASAAIHSAGRQLSFMKVVQFKERSWKTKSQSCYQTGPEVLVLYLKRAPQRVGIEKDLEPLNDKLQE